MLPLALGLSGCFSAAVEEEDELDAPRPLSTWVVMERVHADGQVRTHVSAKFVQVAESDRALAAELVGVRPSLPALGECALLEELERGDVSALLAEKIANAPQGRQAGGGRQAAFNVDLVDVGDVRLLMLDQAAAGSAATVTLAPRAFPDIGDFVSGVMYTSPDREAPLAPQAKYALGASGSAATLGFTIDVDAPPAPEDVTVRGGSVTVGSDLHVSWAKVEELMAEVVYIDLHGLDPHGADAYRCAFADQGEAVLPRELVREGDRGRELSVSLHRLVERNATVRSDDAAEEARDATIVFDFARTLRVPVR